MGPVSRRGHAAGTWCPAIDLEILLEGGRWLQGARLLFLPRARDFTEVDLAVDAVIHVIVGPADNAALARIGRGTRIEYLGLYPDQTEGIEAEIFQIIDGPYRSELVTLGTGGRWGNASFISGDLLVREDHPALSDPRIAETLLGELQAEATANGAPGYAAG